MDLEDWDCHHGRMSVAFWDWNRSAEEARDYFNFTHSTCDAAYERVWERVGHEIADTEYDQYDAFEACVDILPISSIWILRSSVIKEAVSAFEAYVENAVNEVRRRTNRQELPSEVRWSDVVSAYDELGAEYHVQTGLADFVPSQINTPAVDYIRNLRHVLTHRRGELRTERDRKRFADIAGPNEFARVELSDELVARVIDTLDVAARALDPLPWYLAGQRRFWATVHERQREATGKHQRAAVS